MSVNAILKDVCRIGQGALCCRYLLAGGDGFQCGKLDAAIRNVLDRRVAAGTFMARGDNCDGHSPAELNVNALAAQP